MNRTYIKNNSEYEDFFGVTDHLYTDVKEISYRKTKIADSNLPEERVEQSIVSFEKIGVENMLGIFKYLNYKLPEIEKEYEMSKFSGLGISKVKEKKDQKEWFQKNLRFFEQKLSQIEDTTTFITPDYAFFCMHFEKVKYKDDQKVVGRLYNNESIQTLPREIRYYLFKNDYRDFDMVNSHPSILYEFSLNHPQIKLNGSLEQYVKKRPVVFEQIQREMVNGGLEIKTDSEIKTTILKLLNKEKMLVEGMTETLTNLYWDFKVIRDHLYFLYCQGLLLKEYKHALEHSKNKGKLSPKVCLQSFYCQTQETFHINSLVVFLRKKYSQVLKVRKKNKFTDYFPVTDKKVELSAKRTLFIVPFFDGVYISSPEPSFNLNLLSFVEEFNRSGDKDLSGFNYISFKQKKIKKRTKQIVDVEELSDFLVIHRWLTKRSSRHLLTLYFNYLKTMDSFLNELQIIEEKEKNSLDSENLKEQWDADYKDLVKNLKLGIYKNLLSQKFKDEKSIEDYIKNQKDK